MESNSQYSQYCQEIVYIEYAIEEENPLLEDLLYKIEKTNISN